MGRRVCASQGGFTRLGEDPEVSVLVVVPQLIHVQHRVLLVRDVIPVGHDGGPRQHHTAPLVLFPVLLLKQVLYGSTHQLFSPRGYFDFIVYCERQTEALRSEAAVPQRRY